MNKLTAAIVVAMALTWALPAEAATEPAGGAKDLFFRQLDMPKVALNNGMQYWIELKRDGQISRVNSRFPFRSADEIRFHITSNTNGFAYIILSEGSSGNRVVLFPDPGHADNPVVNAAREYTIPGDGFLQFDDVEGTERLTILIARQRLDTDRYLAPAFKDKVVVASKADGSKDLVPGSFVVASANTAPRVDVSSAAITAAISSSAPSVPVSGKNDDDSVITVVQTQPSNVLAVDVILEHRGRAAR